MNTHQFAVLSDSEKALLVKAPAIIAVLAAGKDGSISDLQRAEATKLADIKTFAAPEMLRSYFTDADRNFEQNFRDIAARYCPFGQGAVKELESRVDEVNHIINKLEPPVAAALRKSLAAYAKHVHNADTSFVENYLLPFMN